MLKNCEYCGKEFKAVSSKKYCSEECFKNFHTKEFICVVCGEKFKRYAHGNTNYQTCGKICGGKLAYSKHDGLLRPEALEKSKATLRSIGHRPAVQGGNGRGTTLPQDIILSMLNNGWKTEFVVTLGKYLEAGYPHHYKIDIANPKLKIAVEIDGYSHSSKIRKLQDKKKEEKLKQMGWKVIRFKNQEVLQNRFGCLEGIKCLMG